MRTREDCKIGKVDGRNPVCPGFRLRGSFWQSPQEQNASRTIGCDIVKYAKTWLFRINTYLRAKVIGMNVFSTFDTGVMVALLLGIEFLRSDIRTILYCKRNDPRILKSCLYTLLILLTSLYSIVAGAMLHPEPVPVYELIPGFQYGVYGFSFSFILLAVACLYRKTLPFVLLGYAMIYVIGVLIPLLRYVVSMMDYFTRTRV